MAEFSAEPLLITDTASVWDVVCGGTCRHRSEEECSYATHLVLPYRGAYVHHVGRREAVAEARQLIFINEGEGYQVSHPVGGGDASLSLTLAPETLAELAPPERLAGKGPLRFDQTRLSVSPEVQLCAALLRRGLKRGALSAVEAEALTVGLVELSLGERAARAPAGAAGRQKIVDRAKLVLASDLARRWTLAEVAAEVGVSPVYLTQLFRQVEGAPLYRYQLQLRLSRALELIDAYEDLTMLGLDLGFSSHSHFTAAFRKAYGRTPSDFRSAGR